MDDLPPSTLPPAPEPRIATGIVVSIAVGFAGMLAWFFLTRLTGFEFGILAWGLGALIGFAAVKAAGYSAHSLGLAAGCAALISILGGHYLLVYDALSDYAAVETEGAYDHAFAFATGAVACESDDDFRAFLASWNTLPGHGAPDPASVGDEEVAAVRADLPWLQTLADGTFSREAYEAEIRAHYLSPAVQFEVLKDSFSLFTLLWLFLGVGTAWRIASHGSDD
ncbi:MAG: hypothetical protein EA425_11515 [Puniceicoccaceae bacterium]|nr:MAG: hypothetical protein EA425_11515 [Puniceicoccaceae bacterium]